MTAGPPSGLIPAIEGDRENNASVPVSNTPEKEAPGDQPTNEEDAVRTMTNQSEAKPITIRQAAPLVLVLTGATFLSVSLYYMVRVLFSD